MAGGRAAGLRGVGAASGVVMQVGPALPSVGMSSVTIEFLMLVLALTIWCQLGTCRARRHCTNLPVHDLWRRPNVTQLPLPAPSHACALRADMRADISYLFRWQCWCRRRRQPAGPCGGCSLPISTPSPAIGSQRASYCRLPGAGGGHRRRAAPDHLPGGYPNLCHASGPEPSSSVLHDLLLCKLS